MPEKKIGAVGIAVSVQIAVGIDAKRLAKTAYVIERSPVDCRIDDPEQNAGGRVLKGPREIARERRGDQVGKHSVATAAGRDNLKSMAGGKRCGVRREILRIPSSASFPVTES